MYQKEVAVAWKPTGRPTVRQQRDKWVVRVDGIDTETGKHRPRQLGTCASRRTAQSAATSFAAGGNVGADRDTVGHLVEQWAAGRVDVSSKAPRSPFSNPMLPNLLAVVVWSARRRGSVSASA